MFPKKNKISIIDFKKVYAQGKSTTTPLFRIITNTSDKEYSRFAVVVSKKKIKRAVGRNRQKRRIFSILKELNLPHPQDVIVLSQQDITDIDTARIQDELMSVIGK